MLHTENQVIYSHPSQNKILKTILILLPSHELIILVSAVLGSQYLDQGKRESLTTDLLQTTLKPSNASKFPKTFFFLSCMCARPHMRKSVAYRVFTDFDIAKKASGHLWSALFSQDILHSIFYLSFITMPWENRTGKTFYQ